MCSPFGCGQPVVEQGGLLDLSHRRIVADTSSRTWNVEDLGEACGTKEILVWPPIGGFRCWNASLRSQLPLWGLTLSIYIYTHTHI